MRTERCNFPGSDGHLLDARLDLPDDPPRAYALFAHCFTCGKDINAANRVSAGLAVEGVATLRFDFAGIGGSDGEFVDTDFCSNITDLASAADHMRSIGRPVTLLIGHSLGGAAVLAVAAKIPEMRAVAVIGAPFDVAGVLRHFDQHLPTIDARGEAVVHLAGRPFRISRRFVEEARSQDQVSRIASLGRALLIMHAPGDTVVAVDEAYRIYDAACHPKSIISLADADHMLSRREDAAYAARVLAAWASHYLP